MDKPGFLNLEFLRQQFGEEPGAVQTLAAAMGLSPAGLLAAVERGEVSYLEAMVSLVRAVRR